MVNKEKMKSAGYQYYISWENFHAGLGTTIKKGFPATSCSVKIHLRNLLKKKDTLNLKVEPL